MVPERGLELAAVLNDNTNEATITAFSWSSSVGSMLTEPLVFGQFVVKIHNLRWRQLTKKSVQLP